MIHIPIHTQPDDETCGPTSLHAIYQFYGLNISLEQVITEVKRSASGGTLAPFLGIHALSKGFDAYIYINNLNIFDPTWFIGEPPTPAYLIQKLEEQCAFQDDKAVIQASHAYEEFLKLGGEIRFKTLNIGLLKKYFSAKIPVLTALSSTYLYRCKRELFTKEGKSISDDIRGKPCGHFVILCGYDDKKRLIVVADPHRENPISHDNNYKVSSSRLINSILLGVYTFDANLLIIQPKVRSNGNYNRHR